MLNIDGSFGEGGGQILRSSLALAMMTAQPFRITNIRSKREKSGLMRQHLTAVSAAATICHARVTGAAMHSTELTFEPGSVEPGNYTFAIGTAGSTTLVLQTVLPPLLTARDKSTLTLSGGTHNPLAPPYDFLARTYLPQIERMGPKVTATLERTGFAPGGGGQLRIEIEPVAKLAGFELLERGPIPHRAARVLIANLPRSIGERERRVIHKKLGWDECLTQVEERRDTVGPGNVVLLEIGSEHVVEVFSGFGSRGTSAESVAEQAVDMARVYLASDVPVGEFLADQLLLPLAVAGKGAFRTVPLSRHSTTHVELIGRFLDVQVTSERASSTSHVVQIG